jgi:hypothetical protein
MFLDLELETVPDDGESPKTPVILSVMHHHQNLSESIIKILIGL